MIRRILLALDTSFGAQTSIQHSMDIYQQHPFFVTAMAVLDRKGILRERESRRIGATPNFTGDARTLLEDQENLMNDMLARFNSYAVQCGVSHMDREIKRASVEDIIEQSKYYDMIAMGIDSLLPFGDDNPELTINRIVKESCCPVLGVPKKYRPIRRVAICFNGSMPSARVLHQYAHLNPFDIDMIYLVSVGETDPPESIARACDFLRSYGFHVHIANLKGSVKKAITQYVKDQSIDLIALGPHSGSIMNFFFGSLTEALLKRDDVAMFLYS